jgi:HSP20 family protein
MKLMPWRQRQVPADPFEFTRNPFSGFFDDRWESHLPEVFRGVETPRVDLAETDEEIIAKIELPGMKEEDIQVQVFSNQLVVSGERKWEDEKKEKNYYRVESQYGEFRRVIDLPEGLRTGPDEIDATYEKGILTVRIQKAEAQSPVRIPVKGH